ncbi:MAG: hypothetical protein OEW56_12345, partial [Gemmatimonadota bacterium]|nr:hypothetical protein [Gemmatimonadota bacterium]
MRIVHSHAPQWRDGESWSVPTEPQVTIGVLDGPDGYQLFGVAAAARLSDGSFVVVDGGSRTIRRYDTDGRFVWAVGGRGSGPGEFEAPEQVVVTASDSIIIWDNALYRLTRLTPAGELVDVQTVDRGAIAKAVDPPLYPGTASLLPGGALLVRLVEKAKGAPAGIFRPRSGALRTSMDGLDTDTLMFFGGEEQETVRAPWGPFPVALPAAKRTVMTVQPTESRACIGDQEGPAVACFGPGAARVLVRWDADPAPVTADDIDTWRDITKALYAQKMTEAQLRQMLEQVTVPTTRPPYTRLTLDRAGNLWVTRTTTTGTSTAPAEHLVFDPTGVWLGRVAVPPLRVLEIGEDYVLGIHRDDLGVEYLLAYQLLKPVQPGAAVQGGLRASMTPS